MHAPSFNSSRRHGTLRILMAFLCTGVASTLLTIGACGLLAIGWLLVCLAAGGGAEGILARPQADHTKPEGTSLWSAVAVGLAFGALFFISSVFVSSRRWATCGAVACPTTLLVFVLPECAAASGDRGHCLALALATAIPPCVGGAVGDRIRLARREFARPRANDGPERRQIDENPYGSPLS